MIQNVSDNQIPPVLLYTVHHEIIVQKTTNTASQSTTHHLTFDNCKSTPTRVTNTMTSIEQRRQVPIVCPGHTRPLAELQFCAIDTEEEKRNFLISACHDKMPMLRDGSTGDWHGTFMGHNVSVSVL